MKVTDLFGFACPKCSERLVDGPLSCPHCSAVVVSPSLWKVLGLGALLFPFYLAGSLAGFATVGLITLVLTAGNAALLSDPFWLLEFLPKRVATCRLIVRHQDGSTHTTHADQYQYWFYRSYSTSRCKEEIDTFLYTTHSPTLLLDILPGMPVDDRQVQTKYLELLNSEDVRISKKAAHQIGERGPSAVQAMHGALEMVAIAEIKDSVRRLLGSPVEADTNDVPRTLARTCAEGSGQMVGRSPESQASREQQGAPVAHKAAPPGITPLGIIVLLVLFGGIAAALVISVVKHNARVAEKKMKNPKTQAYTFTEECKRQARGGDVNGAIEKLKSALGKWGGKYDAELYCSMATVVGSQGDSAHINRQKYDYYIKAEARIEAGGAWAFDPRGYRTRNLKAAIKVAKDKAGLAVHREAGRVMEAQVDVDFVPIPVFDDTDVDPVPIPVFDNAVDLLEE